MMETIKAAVVQAAPVMWNRTQTLEKTVQLAREAAAAGARLVVFPESFIPGYPRGLNFGTAVGSRSAAGRRQWFEYRENSLDLKDEGTALLAATARREGLFLAIGITERVAGQGTLYCSLLLFTPEGRLALHHRKLKPTGSERIIWGEGDGSDLAVVDTPIGRIGGLICWENYMPLARMALYEQGVQLYLTPTADQRDSWQATLRHIACEGRCFVLNCNQWVTRDHYPETLRKELPQGPDVLCRGGSAIIDPYGNYLAGPLYDQEDILYADIDLKATVEGKMDFDVCGHYARPDVFRYSYLKKKNQGN